MVSALRRTRLLAVILLLLAALFMGCDDGDDNNSDSDASADVMSDTSNNDGPYGLEVTRTEIGNPAWYVDDFNAFATDVEDDFSGVFGALDCLFVEEYFGFNRANFLFYPLPDNPGPEYRTNLTDDLTRCGFTSTDTFPLSDIRDNRGITFTWTIVPREGVASTGSSPYFDSGLILPDAIFTMGATISIEREGTALGETSSPPYPALSNLTDPENNPVFPGKDGFSHFPAWGSFVGDKLDWPSEAGTHQATLVITDASSAGWEINFTFTVTE